jgi:hypothetical protein
MKQKCPFISHIHLITLFVLFMKHNVHYNKRNPLAKGNRIVLCGKSSVCVWEED